MKYQSIAKYILVLIAFCGHFILGSHDISDQLVLCFGEDGHIALETHQHKPHQAMMSAIPSQDNEHDLDCALEEGCQDIAISLSHDELYDTQTPPRFIGVLVTASTVIQPYQIQQSILPLAPPAQTARPPHSENTQTLKNTILLI